MATPTLRVGPEMSRNGLVSVPHWEALCLACNEKLLCLLLLIFSGMRPSQWQKEPLHNVMPSAKELQRGCVALLRVKNNSFKTKREVTVRGEPSFFSCWRQMGWLRKCFCVLEKFIFFIFLTEQDVLKQLWICSELFYLKHVMKLQKMIKF